MQHLDEGSIHAWLDGALSTEEAARAEAHVASCSACADAVAEARGLIAASTRILTALDGVPNVEGAKGAKGARGARGAEGARRWAPATWLVRERIAAVLTLVVAGGALTLVIARNAPQAVQQDLASEPVRTMEVAAADSPAPQAVMAEELRSEAPVVRAVRPRAMSPSPAPARDLVAMRETKDSAPPPAIVQQTEPTVTANAAAAPLARTDDSLRSLRVADARPAETRQGREEDASSSIAEKAVGALTRRRSAEAQAKFAEPRPAAPAVGSAAGAAAPAPMAALGAGPRLVQEEMMTEGGREVRRRIYRVDDLLVTLDERSPVPVERAQRERAQAPARADSVATHTTIRWTDASGTDFALTGLASQERLERIRKLLGY
jgi:hypothetical protein